MSYISLTMNMSISKGADHHLEQNVKFNDQTPDWVYSVPSNPDSTFHAANAADASLAEFFSRPVRIHDFQWTLGTSVYEYIDPWTLFYSNKRVINRINNYNLLRSKLHIKVVVNGNGFFYGRLMVSYLPRPSEISGISLPRALVSSDLVRLSQLPHIYVDPTTSQGGQLDLPFFCPNNAINIPGEGFSQMGVIIVKDLALLQHANNGTGSITVSIFAWATEVELSIPTSASSGAIVPQMGDEYGTGPVSKPAFTIARAAGALSKIPTIAPYAKATHMAANAAGSIASIFGYSRATVVTPSSTIKPEYVGVLANVNTPDNVTKLSLDCKQEVTVDPRVVGLGDADELSILSLAKRESFLAAFAWSTVNAQDDVLYAKQVTPVSFNTFSTGLSQELHLTPVAFTANPFTYWRGSLKFRFQIVASAFHKGRIKIVYDPYLLLSGAVSEYNVNYAHICDLAGERDFTLEFGWGQKTSWLPIQDLQTALAYYPAGDTALLTTPSPSVGANGMFSVVVVNSLTSPSDEVAPIQINVFISASDDFEVCVPQCSHLVGLSWAPGITESGGAPSRIGKLVPQMGDEVADPVDTTVESTPTLPNPTNTLAPSLTLADHTLDVFFGDPVTSFRQCLKRYQFSRSWLLPYAGTNTYQNTVLLLPDIPLYPGAVGGAIDSGIADTSVPTPWNYVKTTLLNYLLPAFAGRRGGIRWKYHLVGVMNQHGNMSATKLLESVGYGVASSVDPAAWDANPTQPHLNAEYYNTLMPHTWCATHVTDVRNNPTLEVEFPYYYLGRFYPTRWLNVTSANASTAYHRLVVKFKADPALDSPRINSYVSTAEDFNLYFFSGVPPLFLVQTPLATVLE